MDDASFFKQDDFLTFDEEAFPGHIAHDTYVADLPLVEGSSD